MRAIILPLMLLLVLPIALAGTLDVRSVKVSSDGVYQYGSVDIRPGSNITVEVEVGNTFTSDEDVDIDDVAVEITLFDIDDDDDIELDFDEFSLEAGERRAVKGSVKIPYAIDDKTYTMEVSVSGESDDGDSFNEDDSISLVAKKIDYEVIVTSAEFSQPSCGEIVPVTIEVTNIGKEDQSDVQLSLENDLLNVNFKTEKIDIDAGSDNSVYDETFNIQIPKEIKGNYPLEVNLLYEGEDEYIASRTFIPFNIKCGEEPSQSEEETQTVTPEEPIILPPPKKTPEEPKDAISQHGEVISTTEELTKSTVEESSIFDRIDDTTILIVLGELLIVFIAAFVVILYRSRR